MSQIDDLVPQHLGRDLDEVTHFISECVDKLVLLELNKLICAKVKRMTRDQARDFVNGDRVSFMIAGKKRKMLNGTWEGTVTKIRGRLVEVFAIKKPHSKKDKFVNWTVSPDMLVPVPKD
jgi:hypothetical protein